MRRAAAAHGVGVIVLYGAVGRRLRLVPADGRGIVAVAEREAVGDELARHRADDGVTHRAARRLARPRILEYLRRRFPLAVALVAHIGMADIAAPDRLPLDRVTVE